HILFTSYPGERGNLDFYQGGYTGDNLTPGVGPPQCVNGMYFDHYALLNTVRYVDFKHLDAINTNPAMATSRMVNLSSPSGMAQLQAYCETPRLWGIFMELNAFGCCNPDVNWINFLTVDDLHFDNTQGLMRGGANHFTLTNSYVYKANLVGAYTFYAVFDN